MPGVVVMPRRNNYFIDALGQLLGGQIGGMMDRQKAANDYRLTNRLEDDKVARDIRVRDDKFRHNTEVVAPYIRENIVYDRADPSTDAQSMAIMTILDEAAGNNMQKSYADMMPSQQAIDTGGAIQSYDPRQGNFGASTEKTSAPMDITSKYQSDATMHNANVAAGASRYATDGANNRARLLDENTDAERNWGMYKDLYGKTPMAGGNGNYQNFNQFSGFEDSGVAMPQQTQKGMTPKDIASIISDLDPIGGSTDPNLVALRDALFGSMGVRPAQPGAPVDTTAGNPHAPQRGNQVPAVGAVPGTVGSNPNSIRQAAEELSKGVQQTGQTVAGAAEGVPTLDLAGYEAMKANYSPEQLMRLFNLDEQAMAALQAELSETGGF
jgi:hypothetical protein